MSVPGMSAPGLNVLQILRAEAGGELRRLLVAANVAGITNALLLAGVNAAARSEEHAGVRGLVMFVLLLVLFALATRHVNHRLTALIEGALHRIKLRIGVVIVDAELDALERVGAAEICDRITENMTFISDRAGLIATLLQSSLIVLCLSLYIAWLSPAAFGLVALVIGLGLGLFVSLRREFVVQVRHTQKARVVLLERLGDLLGGFKQLRFGRRRSADLRADIASASDSLRRAGSASSKILADNMLLGEGVLYALLGAIVYVLHHYTPTSQDTLAGLVATATFLWGPFVALAMGMMPYIRANLALAEISALERRLSQALRHDASASEDPWTAAPRSLELHALEYSYAPDQGEAGFHVGPVDLRFSAGEIVFIVGGNGSGKSTLLKLLTGLYPASAGRIELDGVALTPERVPAYRERISAIFGDFHLFERLHGLDEVPDEAVERLLADMQLADVTGFVDRSFTKLALSTGQRKRLAMIVSLLEDRPIVVFDEWAADQDPEFRQYFYDELLPQLRSAGKLVLAVSHDDRYFDRADRVVVMDYGQIREIHERRVEP